MKICTLCKQDKPLNEFNKKNSSRDGLQNVCRSCNRVRSKRYYKENHDKHRVAVRERNKILKARNREYVANYLSTHPCVDCGNPDLRVLEFDHVSGDKIDGVGRLMSSGMSINVIQTEIDKCEVRCRNCHTIKTYERLGGSWHDKFATMLE